MRDICISGAMLFYRAFRNVIFARLTDYNIKNVAVAVVFTGFSAIYGLGKIRR